MSKPVRSEAELIEMARAGGIEGACGPAGWHHHLDLRDGDSWQFRARADKATEDRPAIPRRSQCWCRSATISPSSMT